MSEYRNVDFAYVQTIVQGGRLRVSSRDRPRSAVNRSKRNLSNMAYGVRHTVYGTRYQALGE